MAVAGKPILVVDDDEVVLSFIEAALTDEGYDVLLAANGKEALDVLRQQEPGLILLDMRMPIMDGWAFAEAYRKQPGRRAPIVVLTAAVDAARRAAEIGAAAYLPKPCELDDLLDLVGQHAPAA